MTSSLFIDFFSGRLGANSNFLVAGICRGRSLTAFDSLQLLPLAP
jgi:hypothetical protein